MKTDEQAEHRFVEVDVGDADIPHVVLLAALMWSMIQAGGPWPRVQRMLALGREQLEHASPELQSVLARVGRPLAATLDEHARVVVGVGMTRSEAGAAAGEAAELSGCVAGRSPGQVARARGLVAGLRALGLKPCCTIESLFAAVAVALEESRASPSDVQAVVDDAGASLARALAMVRGEIAARELGSAGLVRH